MPVDDYMDKFYKHKVLNIIKKPLLLKHNLEFQSDILRFGCQKIKIYRKIIREICRFYSSVLRLLSIIYIRNRLKLE